MDTSTARLLRLFLAVFGDSVSIDIFFRRLYPPLSASFFLSMYLETGGSFEQIAQGSLFWLLFCLTLILVLLSIIFTIKWFISWLLERATWIPTDADINSRIVGSLPDTPPSRKIGESWLGSPGVQSPSGLSRQPTAPPSELSPALSERDAPPELHESYPSPTFSERVVIEAKDVELIWKVELDDGWKNLEAEQQRKLNDAMAGEGEKLCFKRRGFNYEVRFESKTTARQVNLQTGKERKLRARPWLDKDDTKLHLHMPLPKASS